MLVRLEMTGRRATRPTRAANTVLRDSPRALQSFRRCDPRDGSEVHDPQIDEALGADPDLRNTPFGDSDAQDFHGEHRRPGPTQASGPGNTQDKPGVLGPLVAG